MEWELATLFGGIGPASDPNKLVLEFVLNDGVGLVLLEADGADVAPNAKLVPVVVALPKVGCGCGMNAVPNKFRLTSPLDESTLPKRALLFAPNRALLDPKGILLLGTTCVPKGLLLLGFMLPPNDAGVDGEETGAKGLTG
jgi:hypothetical protein